MLDALQNLGCSIDVPILERLIDAGLVEELCEVASWDPVLAVCPASSYSIQCPTHLLQEELDKEASSCAIKALMSIMAKILSAGSDESRILTVDHRRRRRSTTAITSKWAAVMKRVSIFTSRTHYLNIITLA